MKIDFSKYHAPKESKNKYLSVAFTEEQFKKITEYSKKETVMKSQFVREILAAGIAYYEDQR